MGKIEIIVDQDSQDDLCPMGCGKITDDIYGGPCSQCESQFPQKTTVHFNMNVAQGGYQKREYFLKA